MQPLSNSAKKVQDFLKQHGFDEKVVELPGSTRTAVEAAEAIGCSVDQIVKSLVFMCAVSKESVLVIASGSNRVNEKLIGEYLGESIKIANADFVRLNTGYGIGGVPPVGHTNQIMTFIDEDLLKYAEIWAAAGTPHAVFPLSPDMLVEMTSGRVVSIK